MEGEKMELFEIIVGVSSIGSFFVAIIALYLVNDIKKNVNKTSQKMNENKIKDSRINQVGGDYNSD